MNTEQNAPTPKTPFDYESIPKNMAWIFAGIGIIIQVIVNENHAHDAISASILAGKAAGFAWGVGYFLGAIIRDVVRLFKGHRTKVRFRERTTEDKAKIVLILIIVILGIVFCIGLLSFAYPHVFDRLFSGHLISGTQYLLNSNSGETIPNFSPSEPSNRVFWAAMGGLGGRLLVPRSIF